MKAFAFVNYEDKHPKKVTEVHMTGYINYAPFGWVDSPDKQIYGNFHTLFQPMIDDLIVSANLKMKYDLHQPTVDDLVQKVREGEIDLIVGAYFQTELFRGVALLYPAALYNPITVFTVSNRVDNVKTTEDLKKLKGIRNTNEIFSDFVEKQIKDLNLAEADSAYSMFEKLFKREADYIVTSYYNGMVEAIKLGLQNQVAPAKQTLWRIPMFVGVSKTSKHRDLIEKRLIAWLHDENNIKRLQASLQKTINEIEEQYKGVVPPSFVTDEESEKDQAVENLNNTVDVD